MATDTDPGATVDKAEFDKLQSKYDNVRAQVEDLTRRFKGIDPDKVKADEAALLQLQKEGAGGDQKKIDELLAAREAALRKDLAGEIDSHKTRAANAEKALKELTVTDKVFTLGASRFVDQAADDFKGWVRQYGDLNDDGQIVFKDENGKVRYSPKNPSALMSADEFIDWVIEKKPHWAKPTQPSGTKEPGQKVAPSQWSNIKTLEDINRLPNAQVVWASLPIEKKREIASQMKF